MNVRVLAIAAVFMGVVTLAVTMALPWIAEQSYAGRLERYGAGHLARSVAYEEIMSRWFGVLITALLSVLSIGAGILLLRHRPVGARVWLGVCVAFIVLSLVDFARTGISAAGILRLALWGVALIVSIPVLRKHGPAWFAFKA
jgi:hypothetical protein